MKERIENELRVLVGLPFEDAGRVVDMEWFSFGEERTVIDSKGRERQVGDFAIHVQCAWRITGPNGIVVASRDRYAPSENWSGNEEEFEWDVQGANRCDQLIREFFNKPELTVVKSVEADIIGGFRLFLSHDFTLEVFPDDSLEDEHWRFFKPWSDLDHFVVTGKGIEE